MALAVVVALVVFVVLVLVVVVPGAQVTGMSCPAT